MTTASGARAPVTRDAVLDAALRVVDTEGPAALSMRRLGRECGVEAMSLYHHVPDKAAVLQGVVERVVDGIDLTTPPEAQWQEQALVLLTRVRDALVAHPGVLPLVLEHASPSPGWLRLHERVTAVLLSGGLPPREVVYAGQALWLLVLGHAMSCCGHGPVAVGPPSSTRAGAVATPVEDLAARLDPTVTPALAAVVAAVPPDALDWDEAFALALSSMLRGLAACAEGPPQAPTGT